MNKKQKVRKRTWKYFFEQKLLEILLGFLFFSGVLILFYTLGSVNNYYDLIQFKPGLGESNLELIVEGFFVFVLLLLFLLISSMIIYIFIYILLWKLMLESWLKWNWEKAEKRAKEDFKSDVRRSKTK